LQNSKADNGYSAEEQALENSKVHYGYNAEMQTQTKRKEENIVIK
jgi:hypothetical protein